MLILERGCKRDRPWVLNALNDIIEMQKARVLFADTPNGRVVFEVELYSHVQRYAVKVRGEGDGCVISVETEGSGADTEKLLDRMFALIYSFL